MKVIGIDAVIKGYGDRPRYISMNLKYDIYRDNITIKDLVAMCVKGVSGLKLDDILCKAELEINNDIIEMSEWDDGLKQYIDKAEKDSLGIPQIKLDIQKPIFYTTKKN
ncbi:MAG: hypothetical protein AABW84_02535 [Nanoarchaeota archaeon]